MSATESTHPLESDVREYLRSRLESGNNYVKTSQIAKGIGETSHTILPVVRQLRSDGTLEVFNDGNLAIYRIANPDGEVSSDPAPSSTETAGDEAGLCSAPTKNGYPCRNRPFASFDRCSEHIDLTDIVDDNDTKDDDRPVWERQREELLGRP